MADADAGTIFPNHEYSTMRQRRFGGKGAPIQESGDCWATAVACFAGLTERDRNELHRRIVLSDLALQRNGKDHLSGGNWWNVTQRFLTERVGRLIGWVLMDDPTLQLDPEGIYIASGRSPRGDWWHSVLAHGDGSLVWDPHPSSDGLASETQEWCGWWEGSR